MRAFQERILGKGIVLAKDVPGFVANRLGVHGMVVAGRLMVQHDLTIPEVDNPHRRADRAREVRHLPHR